MKKLFLFIAVALTMALTACDSGSLFDLPDGASYTVTPLYQYYPTDYNGSPAHFRVESYGCTTDGWLYMLGVPSDQDPNVYNDDGSQVICSGELMWRTDAEQTSVPVYGGT